MARAQGAIAVEVLDPADVVAAAQCMVIDADAFPYSSAIFGQRGPWTVVWIARDDGEVGVAGKSRVVGFVAASVQGRSLEIHGVAVDGEHRRRGIARQVLRSALASSAAQGLRLARLHVWDRNEAAVDLYLSEGFEIRHRLRDFYPIAAFGPERDALEMVKPLP